jgi:hypothetical protein
LGGNQKASKGAMQMEQLYLAMQRLRAEAVNRKLDMTDAFEEYAGSGYERNMGVMDKYRFKSTMGTLFRGSVSNEVRIASSRSARAANNDGPDQIRPRVWSPLCNLTAGVCVSRHRC